MRSLPFAEVEATSRSDQALVNGQQVSPVEWHSGQEHSSVDHTNPLKNTDLGGVRRCLHSLQGHRASLRARGASRTTGCLHWGDRLKGHTGELCAQRNSSAQK